MELLRRFLEPHGPTNVDDAMLLVRVREFSEQPWFQEHVRAIQRVGFTVADFEAFYRRMNRKPASAPTPGRPSREPAGG